jgi:hypothetical protein
MTDMTVEKKSSKGLMVGGVLVLLFLLAAAFMGGRLLAPEQETAVPLSGVAQSEGLADLALPSGDSPEGAQTFSQPMLEAAPDMPAGPPEAQGLYIGRTDDMLTIGTGSVTAMISTDPDAVPEFNYDGVAVGVLVTNQTKLYQDVTEFALGQSTVQQELVQLETLDDLQDNTLIQVWGQRDGDRIIAEVIVIS